MLPRNFIELELAIALSPMDGTGEGKGLNTTLSLLDVSYNDQAS